MEWHPLVAEGGCCLSACQRYCTSGGTLIRLCCHYFSYDIIHIRMSSRLLLRLTRHLSHHNTKLYKKQPIQSEPLLHYEFVPSISNEHNQHLLVLHGILGYGKLYQHLATNPKTQSHYNSYLLDFRNHGQSFWSDEMSVEDMARDVKKWLDAHNFPERSLTAVGHSMGARVLVSLT